MFKEKPFTLFSAFLLTLFLGAFSVTPAYAEETTDNTDPFARFGSFTEGSDLTISHKAWNAVLEATVGVIRPTRRRMSSIRPRPKSGKKISRGSTSPSRYESNRVMFHLLEEEHVETVTRYRKVMEVLPNYYPLADFDKDEQLAYWLNLHNAVLYEQLAKRYPISKLKKLRNGRGNQPSLWDEKLITVEGVPLSLNDIQNNILIRHWQTPMVLYGFYHGAIGGPSLPNRAFTGENVHFILGRAAKEFVNSNRGFRMWSSQAQVSLLYDWGKAAFPNWESDLVRHLMEFAKGSHRAELESATSFTAKVYDWSIADSTGGTLSVGPIVSTAAGLITMRSSVGAEWLTELWAANAIASEAYNPTTARLFRGIVETRRLTNVAHPPEGLVTSFECGTGPCPVDLPDVEPEDEVLDPEGDIKD